MRSRQTRQAALRCTKPAARRGALDATAEPALPSHAILGVLDPGAQRCRRLHRGRNALRRLGWLMLATFGQSPMASTSWGRRTQRNVKHWSSGEMGLRWTAAGMLEASRRQTGGLDTPTSLILICTITSKVFALVALEGTP